MADVQWRRRIIICCDGTWQSSATSKDNVASNVTKLARHIARTGTDSEGIKYNQMVYYDSGVGTGSLSFFEKARQGSLGDGLADNVIEAYNFISLNYKPGDEIFLFGFSRGAYTVRAVAGLVTDIGVLEPSDMGLFPALYRGYMTRQYGESFKETQAWKAYKATVRDRERAKQNLPHEHHDLVGSVPPTEIDTSVKIKVVGVWDTVGSLGVPDGRFTENTGLRSQFGFHNVRLSRNIEHAFHALALDERRRAFSPTLWYIPYEDIKEAGDLRNLPELKQVWFPGYHINIGGGSDDGINEMKGDLEAMANITFAWMIQCISPYLQIDLDAYQTHAVDYKVWLDKVEDGHCMRHHASQEGYGEWLYNKFRGPPAPGTKTHSHLIDRGWGTGPMPDSLTGFMYNYAGAVARTPGACKTEVWENGKYITKPIKEVGITNEYIHPVAAYRHFDYNNSPKQNLGWFESMKSSPRPAKDRSKPQVPFKQKKHEMQGRTLIGSDDIMTKQFCWLREDVPPPKWHILDHDTGRVKAKQFYWDMGDVMLPEWVIMDHRKNHIDFERFWVGAANGYETDAGNGREYDEFRWLEWMDTQLKDTFDYIRDNPPSAYPGVLRG